MDLLWLPIAFLCGFIARQFGLPPLVGFLVAGFTAHTFDVRGGEVLETMGDIGVTLLLFTIGLKLDVRGLLRPQIWAVASIHMIATVVLLGAATFAVSFAGLSLFGSLDLPTSLLIAFAMSFSSTVFAVKVLEEREELSSTHGRIAIGILIMQDVFAVVFITASSGTLPSPWAILLVGLFVVRPLLVAILQRAGHGELLVLCGLAFALGAYELFELVQLKGGLGALIVGAMLASCPKANELSAALLSFKDVLLVGFFLSIGLRGVPSLEIFGVALAFSIVMPIKVVLFFWLLTRLRVRARTSLKASFNLANYSEFGLIVAVLAQREGWIASEWLLVLAVAVSITYVFASLLNAQGDAVFASWATRLRRYESDRRLPEDELIPLTGARVVVFGMGRIGTAAYDEMRNRLGDVILGVDSNEDTVERQKAAGRNVILGDATDPQLCRLEAESEHPEIALLAMQNHREMIRAARTLVELQTFGRIAAAVRFGDQVDALREIGVSSVYNLYTRAGVGFAKSVCDEMPG